MIIISQRPNRPGMRGPTPCTPHPPGHSAAPLPSFYCSGPTLCPAQPSPSGLPRAADRPPPSSMGRFSPARPTPAAGPAPGFPREAGCRPGLGRFPTDQLRVASVRPGACPGRCTSEFRSWLGLRPTHRPAPSESCLELLWVHRLTCPTLSRLLVTH
uniref:Uncharacterized protein n=1 Tax=Pipistrellus kuhlii TaxID=59472 RepID=A0A7J7U8G1_PIPKU|nr:hypothetical protein mPipKuh1_009168 [Pipistrellus kuhlii]